MEDYISEAISASPLLSFHRSLCEIESTTNNEGAVGEYLVSYLKEHNFHVLRQDVAQPPGSGNSKRRFNVFAWPRASASNTTITHSSSSPFTSTVSRHEDDDLGSFRPKVILTSHIDTVPPYIPYSASSTSSSSTETPEEAKDKLNTSASSILISGRGTVDAKACVAAQTHAVLSLLSSSSSSDSSSSSSSPPPPLPAVALLFVVGEEKLGDGMKTFSASPLHHHSLAGNYKTLIFGEPTELALASGHKGLTLFSLRARGKAAHSGYPWLGRSANSMLIPVLAALDRLGDLPEEEGGLPSNDKYGNSTVNVGLMRGGVAANVVPENAEAEVAVRLAGGTTEEARQIISKAVNEASSSYSPESSTVSERDGNEQGEGKLGVELIFADQGYAPVDLDAGVDGFDEKTVNYGTDVPNLKVLGQGVKRYLYGPGSILVAHGDHEALSLADLEASLVGYRRLIERGLE